MKLQFDQDHGRFHDLAKGQVPPPVTSGFAEPSDDDWNPGSSEPPF